MKIKITGNVAHAGKILKKDAIVELPEKDACLLLDGKHAVPLESVKQQQQQQTQIPVRSDEEILKELSDLSKPELGKVLAKAKAVKEGEGIYAEAKAIIHLVENLLKK
jgi:hypothetical protein